MKPRPSQAHGRATPCRTCIGPFPCGRSRWRNWPAYLNDRPWRHSWLWAAFSSPRGGWRAPGDAAGALSIAGCRRIARGTRADRACPVEKGRLQAGSLLLSLAMLVIAASLSLPGSSSVALLGFGRWSWAELWASRHMLPPRHCKLPSHLPCSADGRGSTRGIRAVGPSCGFHHPVRRPRRAGRGSSIGNPEPAAGCGDSFQQLTLPHYSEGSGELFRLAAAAVALGRRSGSVHVASAQSLWPGAAGRGRAGLRARLPCQSGSGAALRASNWRRQARRTGRRGPERAGVVLCLRRRIAFGVTTSSTPEPP